MSGAENSLGAVAQTFQRKADMGYPRFALNGQRDSPSTAVKQGGAKMLLQLSDALTDCCLRQSDVVGGGGEAAQPRRRFESTDPFEWWKTIPFH